MKTYTVILARGGRDEEGRPTMFMEAYEAEDAKDAALQASHDLAGTGEGSEIVDAIVIEGDHNDKLPGGWWEPVHTSDLPRIEIQESEVDRDVGGVAAAPWTEYAVVVNGNTEEVFRDRAEAEALARAFREGREVPTV